jgi:hypothetical protein
VVAVATWNHKPTADELLQRRLGRGWKPRTTSTTSGDVILGHAACLFTPDHPHHPLKAFDQQ